MTANINATFALVILNKNDAHSLNLVLNETNFKLFDSVLGIDGDSKDNSLEIFKKYSIPCANRISGGRGGAIKFAIENISEDFVIFLSSDGEENPEDLIKIKEDLLKGADLVIASRMLKNSGFKSDHNYFYIHRKIFLSFISFMVKFFFGGDIKDCWNGYRGLNTKIAKTLKLDESDFLLEAQMTIKFLKKGYSVREVPTRERPRYFGESQNPVFLSGWRHIVLLIREFFSRD